MRISLLFFCLGLWTAIAQDPKIKTDSMVIQMHDFEYAIHLDSLIQKELFLKNFEKIEAVTGSYTPELHRDTLKQRLKFLNSKTPLNIVYTPFLEQLIRSFLKDRKTAFEALMMRSQYYFPLFEQVFDRENIPLEIKYLAVVESALRPTAKSPVGASGLWQFMFSTAKQYDLEVSSYVDERCDPVRSTIAAAKYLKKLHTVFQDWDLALAAYNAGPGNVTKAIRRSGGYKNYWEIRSFLPSETANYIPAFLATMYIFEYAEAHGFQGTQSSYLAHETDTVQVKKMIYFDHLKDVIGVDLKTLRFLNPSFKLDIIPPLKDRNYVLRLPLVANAKFISNEDAIYAHVQRQFEERNKNLPKFYKMDSKIRYIVKSGDYLGKIAKKFRVRISAIKRWNGLETDLLKAGDHLTIYTRNTDYQAERITVSPSENKGKRQIYTVEKGDSLWSISQKFSGISVKKLQDWNGISGKNLKPGMRIIVSN
ncbi:MAG: LysM peptidoglycan-binding domain-containing protein [Bacteroidota bacterium]|nr:LysM peptidoglycan-binding domain-containing protein [Bacteroidota bacterium]